MKRVLVTGPVDRITSWCHAARSVGWHAIEFPLLEIVVKQVEPRDALGSEPAVAWICVTSSSALTFVERALESFPQLAHVATAAVGEHTTEALAKLGCSIAFEPAANAEELARNVLSRSDRTSRVLWPHGDRGDDLARILRGRGLTVVDPIVYETRARDEREVPPSDVVFFASPSAVAAWHERTASDHDPRLAIAIGGTTTSALHAEPEARFERLLTLPEPTPEALADALGHVVID